MDNIKNHGDGLRELALFAGAGGGILGGLLCGGWEALKKATGDVGEARKMGAGNGGQLNPDWVAWLMGWPIGWTNLKPLGMDRFRRFLNCFGTPLQKKEGYMRLTVIDNRVRIEFNGNDIIGTEGDDVRTSAIEFKWEDFDGLVGQYIRGLKRGGPDNRLPPRRCDNCRHAIIEKRLDGMVRCSKDKERNLMDGDNGCDDHLYRKELLN